VPSKALVKFFSIGVGFHLGNDIENVYTATTRHTPTTTYASHRHFPLNSVMAFHVKPEILQRNCENSCDNVVGEF
jgi:hypothetical protein